MTKEMVKFDMPQYGLEETKAKEIENLYIPMTKMLVDMEEDFNKIVSQKITPELSLQACDLRKKIAKVRIAADKARIAAKAESLLIGKAIQGAYNTFEWAVKSKEETLMGIEKHQEMIDIERKEKLREERLKALEKYEVDADHIQVEEMADDVWKNYFEGVKLQYENKIIAEKKAEEDRIAQEKAEEEERKRIRLENEQLKKDAEAKDKKAEEERKRIEAEREAERKEAEVKQAAIEEKARKEREEAEAKEKALEAELQAKRDAEAKALKEAEEADKQARLAPDKEKLSALIKTLDSIEMPELATKEADEIISNVKTLLGKVSAYINEKSKQL